MHIINLEALTEMFFGDASKVHIVVGALVERIPEWQADAQTCAAGNNHEATRELCHRIRGAAGSIKAEKLTASVTHLGDVIKAEQFDQVPACFADLHNCLEEILNLSIDLPS